VSFDANAHRESSLENWQDAAAGWVRRQGAMRESAAPVSHWMVEAIAPQPGQRVLELAAGLGETALLAAELVAPVGGVVISDQAEAMLEGARARAGELGLSNIEFQVLNAEWIDLPLASVDAVLCRWGYMLMADPATALAETRRVLRPGGALALAVWDALDRNPWAQLPAQALAERGAAPAGAPASSGISAAAHGPAGPLEAATPGPFALASSERVSTLLADTGFTEIELDTIDVVRRHASFEDFWETTLDLSRSFHDAVLARPDEEIAEIRDALERLLAPYTDAAGALSVPGRTLVAAARA